MDRLILNGTDGFPLYTDTLAEAQGAWNVFNAFCGMAGDKVILSGCVETGTNVSDGFIVINSEVLPFKGGTLNANIFIQEEITEREFKNKTRKPVFLKRTAKFGSSTPEKTFAWADFKRFDNLIQNAEKNQDFEARLKALETRKSPVPIGLIAIWGKPDTVPIPEGWKECTDLRGRMPLGWNPHDADFDTLGAIGGEKNHTLTINEMPSHNHNTTIDASGDDKDSNGYGSAINTSFREIIPGRQNVVRVEHSGGNQAHNNMPPYRIIKFIEFIGFD